MGHSDPGEAKFDQILKENTIFLKDFQGEALLGKLLLYGDANPLPLMNANEMRRRFAT